MPGSRERFFSATLNFPAGAESHLSSTEVLPLPSLSGDSSNPAVKCRVI